MEVNEHFTPGSTYYYGISQTAIQGGIPMAVIPFPLERRGSTGCSLQATLPDTTTPDQMATSARDSCRTRFGGWKVKAMILSIYLACLSRINSGAPRRPWLDNNGFYGVGVLNLWVDNDHTELAQDQLILVPGPNLFEVVPDGGSTAMLLGLGFLGLFVGRWKLNRRSHAA